MALFSDEKLRYLRSLGLKFDATEDDIKKTYKKLALQHHPDKCQNDPDATKRFQEVSAAYYGLQRLREREARVCYCNCDHAHYHHGFDLDSDCSDHYDSDDEYSQFYYQDDEELMDFFRKIFMDVFSEFVFKKKFQAKRKRPDTYTTEDTEEESFFEFLSRKFRSEGRSSTEDYILTEDDLKKFKSYDEWQKARDPSKPPNRCKRRAVQRSRRHQKEEQKQKNKKQRKNEQRRKDKELLAIRDQLLKTLDEKKEKEKKGQNTEPPDHKPSSEASHLKSRATKSPERLEIERQLAEAKRKEHELQENLRRLEAKEHRQEKKLRKSEKKKAKKETSTQNVPSLPSEQRSFPHKTFSNFDFIESKYGQKNITSSFDNKLPKQISKEERDKGLADLMDKVKRQQRSSDEGGGDAARKMPDVTAAIDTGQKSCENVRQNDAPRSARRCSTPGTETPPETSLLNQHLDAYHELMKLQPRRHTEQQLREERLRIRDAQLRTQQSELDRLRNTPRHDLFKDDLHMKRDELLQKHREKERLRNEEEAFELKKEAERQHSAPTVPVSRKYYENISYHEKQHKMDPHTPHKQTPRRTSRTPPLITTVENPIKREIPNRQSTWSRVVTSDSPWGERTRKQLELTTMLPSNMDEEEEMLQQALALSIQTAELDMQQRTWQEELEQSKADRQIMETAHYTEPQQQPATRNQNTSPSRMKYPLSDKFMVYPGAFVNQSGHNLDEFETRPSWCLPLNPKSETRKVCKPKAGKRDSWSLCPGKPTPDDWSYSKPADIDSTDADLKEYEYEEEERWHQFKNPFVNGRTGESKSSINKQSTYTNTQQEGVNRNMKSSRNADQEKKSLELVTNRPWLNTNENSNNANKDARNQVKAHISRASSSLKETSDDWDVECQWKTEGPSYPLLKYKLRMENRESGKRVNETLLPPTPLSLIRDDSDPSTTEIPLHADQLTPKPIPVWLENTLPCTADGTVQTEEQLTPKPIPVLLGDALPCTADGTVQAEEQLTPKPIPVLLGDTLPCTADSTVQMEEQPTPKPIPGFLDSPLLSTAETPVHTDSQLQTQTCGSASVVKIEAETNTEPLVESDKVPERHDCFTQTKVSSGFVGGFWDSASNNADKIAIARKQRNILADQDVLKQIPLNRISQSNVNDHKDPSNNQVPTVAPDSYTQKSENWDDNLLVSSFAELNVKNPATNRAESSITVNTNHEKTTIPRLPVITAALNDSKEQDQGPERMMTDDQKLSSHHYYVQQAEPTNQRSGSNVSGLGPSPQPSQLSGLPVGLPQHLIQAYLQYVALNEARPSQPQPTPHPAPASLQGIASDKSSSEMTSGPPCSTTSAAYPLPGNPGYMPAMWSHLYPWMGPLIANPVISHTMMPFCPPPVFTYSLQQQIKTQESGAKVTSNKHQGINQRSSINQVNYHLHQRDSCFGQQDSVSKSSGHQSGLCTSSEARRLDMDVHDCSAQKTTTDGGGQQMGGLRQVKEHMVEAHQEILRCNVGQNDHSLNATQEEPVNKGSVGQQMAVNKIGFGQQNSVNKGGFEKQNSLNNGGFKQQNWVDKDGLGQQNSVNKDGLGPQGLKSQMQQNQPSSDRNMSNSNLINSEMTAPKTHSDESCSSRNVRPNIPPRFQRQKRLELNKKIKTLIQEINKEQEDYKETEIVKEEDRISA